MSTVPFVRKAIFPVAGWGTRFLPATKAMPKEMLPIVDKPLVQYAVEEAVAAGVTELIFVTSSTKRAIEDHFDANHELEFFLKQQAKNDLLNIVQGVLPKHVTCVYVRQREMLGLGHAVLCAKELVCNEPFAVLLPDDLIDGGARPCLKQLVDVFHKEKGSVVAVQPIRDDETRRYGVVKVNEELNPYAQIHAIIEKPSPEKAPSRFGVVGRYVLSPRIFELLEKVTPGAGGEIQLTDAIAKLLTEEKVFALQFSGKRYDCGNKLGYLEATMDYALKHSELKNDFEKLLKIKAGE